MVMKNTNQQLIEKQIIELCKKNFSDDLTVQQFAGDFEKWTMKVGEYELFLNPFNCSWFYLDTLHDSYEDTNHKAGEGTFYANRELLRFEPDNGGENFADKMVYQYWMLKLNHFIGKLSEKEFLDEVYKLRFQGADGVWRQVSSSNGEWLKYNGSAWVADTPQCVYNSVKGGDKL